MDRGQDVCQIALVERHRGTGKVINGFVSGFGYDRPCAVASTVAHDSHHMIVVGTIKDDMAQAANRLGEVGGGIVVMSRGQGAGAGRTADRRADVGRARRDRRRQGGPHGERHARCGCSLNNAYMQHSLLALVVIPELRISDLGIVDARKFELVDLFRLSPGPFMARKLILDVDTGTDDAVAIMLAALHPDLDLIGCTTVNGNVEVEHCTDNTLRVLDHIGRGDIPVHEGLAGPWCAPDFPVPRAVDDLAGRSTARRFRCRAATHRKADRGAVEFLIETYRTRDRRDHPGAGRHR